ncbi:MAG: cupin domain-containing protein [Planktomarina sp.]
MHGASDARPVERHILGPDLLEGQRPQIVVPKDHWQAAITRGDWTLVGCTVSPGFSLRGLKWRPLIFKFPINR